MCGANFLRSEGEQEAANWKKGVRYGSISVGMLSRGGGNGAHQQRRQRLHITQPALSKIIGRVEDYAGTALFDRVKGKIQLNDSGKIFARTLDQMFTALNLGLEELHALTREEAHQIRVASSTDGIFLLIGDKFHVDHPDAQIRYSVMPPEHIRQEFMRATWTLP